VSKDPLKVAAGGCLTLFFAIAFWLTLLCGAVYLITSIIVSVVA
jgi:hypothetical protein